MHHVVAHGFTFGGIAAANIEIEGCNVSATTIHNLFDLDGTLTSKLDFSKANVEKVANLVQMQVLFLDEARCSDVCVMDSRGLNALQVSMLDNEIFEAVTKYLNLCDVQRKGYADPNADEFGDVHLVLFGDFKCPAVAPMRLTMHLLLEYHNHGHGYWRQRQLPPATSKPPFIVLPWVQRFDFRVLRQNRRIIEDANRQEEIDNFHQVLADISLGNCTEVVRRFFVDAYVRGALQGGSADQCPLEKVTSVFTKRRYRDSWNRALMRKIQRGHNHSMKIRGMVRARGQRGANWWSEKRVAHIRRMTRTQNLWQLHLAGDWFAAWETKDAHPQPHLMRAMFARALYRRTNPS